MMGSMATVSGSISSTSWTETRGTSWSLMLRIGTFSFLVSVGDGSEEYSFDRDMLGGRQLVKVQVADDDSQRFLDD